MKYLFKEITECEMCLSNTKDDKVLGQRLNKSQGLRPKNKTGISVSIKKCKNCGLIYSNPQPRPFDIQDHYGVPTEDYFQPNYFDWDKSHFFNEIKIVKKLLFFEKGMNALDIGCGVGKNMKSLEEADFKVSGVESSESFYKKALSHMAIKEDQIKLGMVEEIEYTEKFDFITFGAVFEHLYHPAKVLEQVSNWLNKDGIVHIQVPFSRDFTAKVINVYYRLIGSNYVTNLSPMHPPYHLYEFDLDSFKLMSKRLGFKIEYYEIGVGSIYFFPNILKPLVRWYKNKTNTGNVLTIYLRKIK